MCFYLARPLSHILSPSHTHIRSLQHTHKPSVFLTHSFQFTMTAMWILSGFPQFSLFLQRSLNYASYGAEKEIDRYLQNTTCMKIILEGQTCKNVINFFRQLIIRFFFFASAADQCSFGERMIREVIWHWHFQILLHWGKEFGLKYVPSQWRNNCWRLF